MAAAGVPTVPGSPAPIADEAEARALADGIGYPVMIKAAAGGGGKGMKRCDAAADFARAVAVGPARGGQRLRRRPALPREVPGPAAPRGDPGLRRRARRLHLARRARVLGPAPPAEGDRGEPELRPGRAGMREAMGEVAVRAARAVGYRGRGHGRVPGRRAPQLLLPGDEHPAAGRAPGHRDGHRARPGADADRGGPGRAPSRRRSRWSGAATPSRRGSTPRTRPAASCPARARSPTCACRPGPACATTRASTAAGWCRSIYDPLLSKLVAWAPTRDQAIARLLRALDEYTVHGITTNLAWLARPCSGTPPSGPGEYDTGFCARYAGRAARPGPILRWRSVALIAAALSAYKRDTEEAEALRGARRPGGGRGARGGCGWAGPGRSAGARRDGAGAGQVHGAARRREARARRCEVTRARPGALRGPARRQGARGGRLPARPRHPLAARRRAGATAPRWTSAATRSTSASRARSSPWRSSTSAGCGCAAPPAGSRWRESRPSPRRCRARWCKVLAASGRRRWRRGRGSWSSRP